MNHISIAQGQKVCVSLSAENDMLGLTLITSYYTVIFATTTTMVCSKNTATYRVAMLWHCNNTNNNNNNRWQWRMWIVAAYQQTHKLIVQCHGDE